MTTCYKQPFASPQKAMAHARAGKGCRSVRAYLCCNCSMYHLTSVAHMPARKLAAIYTKRG